MGELHEKTKESSECLKHLTHQAVVFQKKMVELGKGDKAGVGLPAIQAILQSVSIELSSLVSLSAVPDN